MMLDGALEMPNLVVLARGPPRHVQIADCIQIPSPITRNPTDGTFQDHVKVEMIPVFDVNQVGAG